MRTSRTVESRRDRKALAKDAGLGKISLLSVLAGAFCALAVFEALITIAGALVVGIHGSTNFAGWRAAQVKTLAGTVVVLSIFVAFTFGGYVSGRMSRRGGATNGMVAGIAGVVAVAVVAAVVTATGTDNGLSRVAAHLQVADTWAQWRSVALVGVVVVIAAMVLGGLAGGIEGERWHGRLLARAIDPSYGPQASEQIEARKHIREAEVARLAAADHVSRVTAVTRDSVDDDQSESEPTALLHR